MTSEEAIASNRNAARDSLFLSTDVVVPGAPKPITVRVRNLSAGGMMIDGNPAFVEGVTVESDLRGIGIVKGRVAWTMPERAGIAFDMEIDPKMARHPVGQNKSSKTVTYARPPLDYTSRPGLKAR
jgi:PilZ domain